MRNLLKIVIAATFFLLPSLSFGASPWLPDSLGARFEKRYVDQGLDYHGVVRSTIIRSLASP